jgi:hypothetical protein
MVFLCSSNNAVKKTGREESWEAQACYEPKQVDAKWKPYKEWQALYEPPKENKEDCEAKKKFKEKTAEKAKTVILAKLHSTISNKLVVIVMEVTSHIMELAEKQMRAKDAPAHFLEICPKLINAMDGIILTYRFEDSGKKHCKCDHRHKCRYLRRLASIKLADMLKQWVDDGYGTAQRLIEMKGAMEEVIESKEVQAVEHASEQLNGFLTKATTEMAEKVEPKIEKVDRILETAGFAHSNSMDVRDIDGIRDEMLEKFGGFVKDLILGKMRNLTEWIAKAITHIIREAMAIYEKQKQMVETNLIELRDEVFEEVEKMHESLVTRISAEVQGVIDVLGGMMHFGKEDDEEDEP